MPCITRLNQATCTAGPSSKYQVPGLFRANAIRILFIENSDYALRMKFPLQRHPLLLASTSTSLCHARETLKQKPSFDICVIDLDYTGSDKECFEFIRAQSTHAAVIAVGSGFSLGFTACAKGVSAALDKSAPSSAFLSTIACAFLDRIATNKKLMGNQPAVQSCVSALRQGPPRTVSAWARAAGISVSYLRELWTGCFGIGPKRLLTVYRGYHAAVEKWIGAHPTAL